MTETNALAEARARVIAMTPPWEKERRAAYEAVDALIAEAQRAASPSVGGERPDWKALNESAWQSFLDAEADGIGDAREAHDWGWDAAIEALQVVGAPPVGQDALDRMIAALQTEPFYFETNLARDVIERIEEARVIHSPTPDVEDERSPDARGLVFSPVFSPTEGEQL